MLNVELVNNQLDQTSQTLLDYIEAAVDNLPEEAIEAIQPLLQNADLSYVCKETGETLFHKMATYWDLNLMAMFHEHFLQSCEHNPNVSAQDKNGRTPLHEAARVNNTDMVEWLLSHEARMEEKTFMEQQTPLHYAARFESIEVMEILLNKGGKISCNMKTNNIIFYPT